MKNRSKWQQTFKEGNKGIAASGLQRGCADAIDSLTTHDERKIKKAHFFCKNSDFSSYKPLVVHLLPERTARIIELSARHSRESGKNARETGAPVCSIHI
jgi:hypothetical protein